MVPGEDVEEEALPPVLPAHPRLSSVLHPGAVFIAVSCSADGGVVAAGSDNTALVWDGRTGGQRHAFRYADRVLCLQVSSQGHLLATGCYDKKLSLHSLLLLQGGAQAALRVLEGHAGRIMSLSFATDDLFLVSSSGGYLEGSVKVWELTEASTRAYHTLTTSKHSYECVAVAPNNQVIVTGDTGKKVTLMRYDHAAKASTQQVLMQHRDTVRCCCFSIDSKMFMTGSDDKTICMWSAETAQAVRVLRGHDREVTALHVSFGNRYLYSVANDTMLRVWELSTGRCVGLLHNFCNELEVSSDGSTLVVAVPDGGVAVLACPLGRPLRRRVPVKAKFHRSL
eukprot:m.187466 g.187466  ORF g.187466 m.187466 type:complete len:339 (+) comp21624_c2_seq3:3760-4776(+)